MAITKERRRLIMFKKRRRVDPQEIIDTARFFMDLGSIIANSNVRTLPQLGRVLGSAAIMAVETGGTAATIAAVGTYALTRDVDATAAAAIVGGVGGGTVGAIIGACAENDRLPAPSTVVF